MLRVSPFRLATAGVAAAALLVTLSAPRDAQAHGGTPYSLRVMRVAGQKTLYMPAYWWGLWVGSTDAATDASAPWHFVCEEAINPYRDRRFALSADGQLYATNNMGVNVARQGGCAWPNTAAATGSDLGALFSTMVATHPTDGATAWVSTGTNPTVDSQGKRTPAHNGLFVTHDHGDTWARISNLGDAADPSYGRTFDSVVVSASDAQRFYVTSTNYQAPFEVTVHKSTDGAATFAPAVPATVSGRGALFALQLLAVDPRDADVFYARATISGATPTQLFVRGVYGTSGLSLTELYAIEIPSANQLDWSKGINDLAFDLDHGQLILATRTGLVRGSAALGSVASDFHASDNLSQTQCVTYDAESGRTWACGGTFGPDFAALACDSATSPALKSIFAFTDTIGPLDCTAGTAVADVCPGIWSSYRSELFPYGTDDGGTSGSDGGVSDGGVTPGDDGGCNLGGGTATTPWAVALLVALVALALRPIRARAAATPRRRGTRRR